MSTATRLSGLVVALAVAAAGCGTTDDVGSPSTTGAVTTQTPTTLAPTTLAPTTRPSTVAPSTTPPPTTEPASRELTAEDVAEVDRFVREFLDAVWSADPAARDMWTGYPEPDATADEIFERFLEEYEWIRTSDDFGWSVMASAGFLPQPVVTITNNEGEAGAFVLSLGFDGSPTVIQRLPSGGQADAFTPATGATVAPGGVITFDGVPIEGGARAYLNGTELADVTVDHEALTTSMRLPDELPEMVILTFTAATPEVPTAVAVVYRS